MTGFVQLRRGLLDHLPHMTGDSVKLYVALLLLAKNSGKDAGHITISIREIGAEIGWSKSKVQRELDKLKTYVSVDPGRNQHAPTRIQILRFSLSHQSGTAHGTAGGTAHGTAKPESGTALGQHWDSTGTAPSVIDRKQKDLRAPDREEGRGNREDREEPPYIPPPEDEPCTHALTADKPAQVKPAVAVADAGTTPTPRTMTSPTTGSLPPGTTGRTKSIDSADAAVEAPRPHGEFGHAMLTLDEFGKLHELMGNRVGDYIERFDSWVHEAPNAKAGGVKRKDRNAYLSMRNWYRRDEVDGKLKGRGVQSDLEVIREGVRRAGG